MMTNDLTHTNNQRFSLISCVTEDSIDSAAIATPLDASPPPPPSNRFSIINIVNDDPFPNTRAYPDIASTLTTAAGRNRRRAQTSPRPVPSSIFTAVIPQPTMIYDNNNNNVSPKTSVAVSNSTPTVKSKFWLRIKHMMLSSSDKKDDNTEKMKQLFKSMNLLTASTNTGEEEEEENTEMVKITAPKNMNSSNMRWLGRNRARVGPQR